MGCFFALDSLYGHSTLGGIRVAADLTFDEVKAQAKEMTNIIISH